MVTEKPGCRFRDSRTFVRKDGWMAVVHSPQHGKGDVGSKLEIESSDVKSFHC